MLSRHCCGWGFASHSRCVFALLSSFHQLLPVPHLFIRFQHSRDPPAALCYLLAPASSRLICLRVFNVHVTLPPLLTIRLRMPVPVLFVYRFSTFMWASRRSLLFACACQFPSCWFTGFQIGVILLPLRFSTFTWRFRHWFRLIRALLPMLVLIYLFLTFMWLCCPWSAPTADACLRLLHSFSYWLLVARNTFKLNCIMKTTMYIYTRTESTYY
jgi:hypothetical protein